MDPSLSIYVFILAVYPRNASGCKIRISIGEHNDYHLSKNTNYIWNCRSELNLLIVQAKARTNENLFSLRFEFESINKIAYICKLKNV